MIQSTGDSSRRGSEQVIDTGVLTHQYAMREDREKMYEWMLSKGIMGHVDRPWATSVVVG